ncbi:unnamed protein product [Brugia timori]|uniref:Dymeclin n=1 Tax=Brugia timori TaxID=42155 RepID=A0A0R3QPZ1_9BILA|nr:unnamed protein product [Brugia timori]
MVSLEQLANHFGYPIVVHRAHSLNNPESLIETSTENSLFGDYDERSWFGESGVPNLARDPIAQFLALLKKPQTMGNLEALISKITLSFAVTVVLREMRALLNNNLLINYRFVSTFASLPDIADSPFPDDTNYFIRLYELLYYFFQFVALIHLHNKKDEEELISKLN